jgi:hypothetical protein
MGKEKLNWKQFIPFYGIYQMIDDHSDGKPSLYTYDNHELRCFIGSSYHGLIHGATIAGLGTLLEKLL